MSAHPPDPDHLARLARSFRDQQRFAEGYAPLTARLFAQVATWLEAPAAGEDPLVTWLVAATEGRQPFAVTNLLLAGLHRDVLAGVPAVADLARFYPTAGGEPGRPNLEPALREAILARRESLATFLQTATVQTNETGRGLVWLLPLSLTDWPAAHLVDLGASAGLNLLADQRHYRLEGTDGTICELGAGSPGQFVSRVTGPLESWCRQIRSVPRLLTRLGGDLRPFRLAGPDDELTLMGFVWTDHVARLNRLREALAVRRTFTGPCRLEPLTLPADLGAFLERHLPADGAPVVIYNTVVTAYLPERGTGLAREVARWAKGSGRIVLWLQWEPLRVGSRPARDDYAWTADIWSAAGQRRHQLGWVHPHGGPIELVEAYPNRARFDKIH